MKAGRELDALIAEKVMELKGIGFWPEDGGHYYHTLPCEGIFDDVVQKVGIPHYSTQIADAWLVVEKLAFEYTEIDISWHEIRKWCCSFYGHLHNLQAWHVAEADTAPLAICLAGLKAVE